MEPRYIEPQVIDLAPRMPQFHPTIFDTLCNKYWRTPWLAMTSLRPCALHVDPSVRSDKGSPSHPYISQIFTVAQPTEKHFQNWMWLDGASAKIYFVDGWKMGMVEDEEFCRGLWRQNLLLTNCVNVREKNKISFVDGIKPKKNYCFVMQKQGLPCTLMVEIKTVSLYCNWSSSSTVLLLKFTLQLQLKYVFQQIRKVWKDKTFDTKNWIFCKSK